MAGEGCDHCAEMQKLMDEAFEMLEAEQESGKQGVSDKVKEIRVLQIELSDSQSKFREAEVDLEETRQILNEKSEEVDSLRGELSEASTRLQELQTSDSVAAAKDVEEHYMRSLREKEHEINKLERTIEDKDLLLSTVESKITAAHEEGFSEGRAEVTALKTVNEQLSEKISTLEATEEEVKTRQKEQVEERTGIEAELVNASTRLQEYKLQTDHEIELAKQQFQESEQNLSAAKCTIDELNHKISLINTTKAQLEKDVESAEEHKQSSAVNISELEVRLSESAIRQTALAEKLKTHESDHSRALSFAKDESSKLEKLISDLKYQLEQRDSRIIDQTDTIESEKATCEALERDVLELKREVESAENSLSLLRKNNEQTKQNSSERELHRKQELEKIISEAQRSREDAVKEASKLRDEVTHITDQMLQEKQRADEIQHMLKSEIDNLKGEARDLKLDVQAANTEKDKQIEIMQDNIDRTTNDRENAYAELSQRNTQFSELETKVQETAARSKLESSRRDGEIESLRQKLEHSEQNYQQATNQFREREAPLKEEVTSLKHEIQSLRDGKTAAASAHTRKLRETEDYWSSLVHQSELKSGEVQTQRDREIRQLKISNDELEFEMTSLKENLAKTEESLALGKVDGIAAHEEVQLLQIKLRDAEVTAQHEQALLEADIQSFKEQEQRESIRNTEKLKAAKEREDEHHAAREEAVEEYRKAQKQLSDAIREFGIEKTDLTTRVDMLRTDIKEKQETTAEEIKSLKEEHSKQLKTVESQVSSAKEKHEDTLITHNATIEQMIKERSQDIENLQREIRRTDEAASQRGRANAERAGAEQIRILQASLDQLKIQQNHERESFEATKAELEESADEWRSAVSSEKNAANVRLAKQEAEFSSSITDLTERLKILSEASQREKKTLEEAETELSQARYEIVAQKSEFNLQLKQVEDRAADQEKWRKSQCQDEKNRREKAEKECHFYRKELNSFGKKETDSEVKLQQRCTRVERELATCQRESASLRAKVEGLGIQLEERDRALKHAGNRIASLLSDKITSLSPRREHSSAQPKTPNSVMSNSGANSTNMTPERNAPTTTELRASQKTISKQKEELERYEQATLESEERAKRLADDNESLEREFKVLSADLTSLQTELATSRRELLEAKSSRTATIESLKSELQEAEHTNAVSKTKSNSEHAALLKSNKSVLEELESKNQLIANLRKEGSEELRIVSDRKREAAIESKRRGEDLRETKKAYLQQMEKLRETEANALAAATETERLKSAISQLNKDLTSSREETRRLSSELQTMKSKVEDADFEVERSKLHSVSLSEKERSQSNREIELLRRKLERAHHYDQEALKTAKAAEVDALVSDHAALRARIRRLDAQNSEQQTKITQLSHVEEAAVKELVASRKLVEEAHNNEADLNEEITDLQGTCNRLQRKVADVSTSRDAVQHIASSLQSELKGARNVTVAAEQSTRRLVFDTELEMTRSTVKDASAAAANRRAAEAAHQSLSALRLASSYSDQLDSSNEYHSMRNQLGHLSTASRIMNDVLTPIKPTLSYRAYT